MADVIVRRRGEAKPGRREVVFANPEPKKPARAEKAPKKPAQPVRKPAQEAQPVRKPVQEQAPVQKRPEAQPKWMSYYLKGAGWALENAKRISLEKEHPRRDFYQEKARVMPCLARAVKDGVAPGEGFLNPLDEAIIWNEYFRLVDGFRHDGGSMAANGGRKLLASRFAALASCMALASAARTDYDKYNFGRSLKSAIMCFFGAKMYLERQAGVDKWSAVLEFYNHVANKPSIREAAVKFANRILELAAPQENKKKFLKSVWRNKDILFYVLDLATENRDVLETLKQAEGRV